MRSGTKSLDAIADFGTAAAAFDQATGPGFCSGCSGEAGRAAAIWEYDEQEEVAVPSTKPGHDFAASGCKTLAEADLGNAT